MFRARSTTRYDTVNLPFLLFSRFGDQRRFVAFTPLDSLILYLFHDCFITSVNVTSPSNLLDEFCISPFVLAIRFILVARNKDRRDFLAINSKLAVGWVIYLRKLDIPAYAE